ncbi:MAG: hypothetical protein ACFCVD_08885 [Nodosilinea sp.]
MVVRSGLELLEPERPDFEHWQFEPAGPAYFVPEPLGFGHFGLDPAAAQKPRYTEPLNPEFHRWAIP